MLISPFLFKKDIDALKFTAQDLLKCSSSIAMPTIIKAKTLLKKMSVIKKDMNTYLYLFELTKFTLLLAQYLTDMDKEMDSSKPNCLIDQAISTIINDQSELFQQKLQQLINIASNNNFILIQEDKNIHFYMYMDFHKVPSAYIGTLKYNPNILKNIESNEIKIILMRILISIIIIFHSTYFNPTLIAIAFTIFDIPNSEQHSVINNNNEIRSTQIHTLDSCISYFIEQRKVYTQNIITFLNKTNCAKTTL